MRKVELRSYTTGVLKGAGLLLRPLSRLWPGSYQLGAYLISEMVSASQLFVPLGNVSVGGVGDCVR